LVAIAGCLAAGLMQAVHLLSGSW